MWYLKFEHLLIHLPWALIMEPLTLRARNRPCSSGSCGFDLGPSVVSHGAASDAFYSDLFRVYCLLLIMVRIAVSIGSGTINSVIAGVNQTMLKTGKKLIKKLVGCTFFRTVQS